MPNQPTAHPLIRAQERALLPQLWPQLEALESAIAAQNLPAAMEFLAALVPEWQRSEPSQQARVMLDHVETCWPSAAVLLVPSASGNGWSPLSTLPGDRGQLADAIVVLSGGHHPAPGSARSASGRIPTTSWLGSISTAPGRRRACCSPVAPARSAPAIRRKVSVISRK